MASTRPTALKLSYKGELHRLRVDLNAFQLSDLQQLFASTFHLRPNTFVIQYKDAEDDWLNVCSDAEFHEACHVFLHCSKDIKTLRFVAVSSAHLAFQENVADPLLKAIEKLVATLNAAMAKVKQEEWAQRAQSKLDHTGRAIHSVAIDARESFSAARQSIQELPIEQMLKDTSEGLKSAAEGLADFAKDVVDEITNFKSPRNSMDLSEDEQVVEPEIERQESESMPLTASSSDSEWEDVEQTTPVEPEQEVIPVVEETPVVVEEPAVVVETPPVLSEGEIKWAEEIALIREFFPSVEPTRVIDQLEQCKGNVQVVLNALME